LSELVFLTPEQRTARYEEVRKQHAREQRRGRRFDRAKTAAIVGLAGLCGWLGWNNGRLAEKAADTAVVYAVIRDDGTVTNSVRFSSLPAIDTRNTAINALWDYVQSRECYNATRSARDWYVVQAMSDARVGREFRDWYGLANKDSPQHVYGDHGIRVDCSFVSYAPLGSNGDRYEFRFDRWEVGPHGQTAPVRYVATVRFRTGVYSPDPQRGWIEKSTFNAPGVQVTEYPYVRAVPEGVAKLEPRP